MSSSPLIFGEEKFTMLKIVHPICCGIDVHKSFVVAVLAITNDKGITEYKRHRFSTFTNQLIELRKWLEYYSCFEVCMESTGKYWIPVYNILEESCYICLAHPKYVKAIRGKKTDKKDAQWIADLFKNDLVSGSFIPPIAIRQLRDLFRYRMKLTNCQTGEKTAIKIVSLGQTFRLQVLFPTCSEKVLKILSRASLIIPNRHLISKSSCTKA